MKMRIIPKLISQAAIYVLLTLLFACSEHTSEQKEWPMFRGNAGRTGSYVSAEVVTLNNIKWKFKAESAIYSSPIVADSVVYFGSSAYNDSFGYIYAVDEASGREKWSLKANGIIMSSPAVVDGVLYIGCSNGYFYAIGASTGYEIWKFGVVGSIFSSPVVVDSIVYFGSNDGNIYAVNTRTGQEKWRFNALDPVTDDKKDISEKSNRTGFNQSTEHVQFLTVGRGFQPGRNVLSLRDRNALLQARKTISNDIVGLSDSQLKKVIPLLADAEIETLRKDGDGAYDEDFLASLQPVFEAEYLAFAAEKKGEHPGSYYLSSSPAVMDGIVYYGCNGNIYALHAKTGQEKWRHTRSKMMHEFSSPLVVANTVYMGADTLLLALHADTGKEKWKFATAGKIISSPAASGGLIYFGSSDSCLYAVSAQTGQEKWRVKADSKIISSPAVINKTLYFGSVSGQLYALDIIDGKERWKLKTEKAIISSVAVGRKVVYVGSTDGFMYALE